MLTEIKANTVKLVLDVELLKANYNKLKESLYSTKSQVDSLVAENIAVKSKLQLLEEQVLTSNKELEEVQQRPFTMLKIAMMTWNNIDVTKITVRRLFCCAVYLL